MKNYTFGTWLKEWYIVYKSPKLKPTSLKSIEICIRLHTSEELKALPLKQVSPIDLQRALNLVASSRMKQYTYTVFSDALKKAFALQLIKSNPMHAVDAVRHHRQIGTALTKTELTTFLCDIEKTFLKRLFTFYLYTGCRRSEALSISWQDIDFNKNTIHISGTKNKLANRTIPLMPELKTLLLTYTKNTDKYIFPYSPNFVTSEFHKICPQHRLHDLRHTFATRCLECGISMKVVQSWLGHSKIDTTASIYTHVVDEYSYKQSFLFSLS